MLVGGTAVFDLFYLRGVECNLWKIHLVEDGTDTFIRVLLILFPIGSLTLFRLGFFGQSVTGGGGGGLLGPPSVSLEPIMLGS